MRKLVVLITLVVMFIVMDLNHADAFESCFGNVTVLEPSYMPDYLTFMINCSTPSCPVGAWRTWGQSIDNNKSIYATLLSALVSGKQVEVFYSNDGTCTPVFLHIVP